MRYSILCAILLASASLCAAGEGELKQVAILGRGTRLLALQGLALLPDGSVLVSDKLDYRVKKLSPAGAQVASVGGRGTEPGQFQGPGPIDCRGDRIAVADHAANRIQILKGDFTPLATLKIDGAVSDLCFDGAGNLWVAAVTMQKEKGLFQFAPDGRRLRVLPLHNAEGDMFYDAGFLAWIGGGRFAFAYFVQNRVEIWDTAGAFLGEFSVAGLPLRAPSKKLGGENGGIQVSAPEGNIFRSIASDGKGRIYLLISDFGSRPGKEIVVVDARGKEIGRHALPAKCVQIRADNAGRLYAIPRERDAVITYASGGGAR